MARLPYSLQVGRRLPWPMLQFCLEKVRERLPCSQQVKMRLLGEQQVMVLPPLLPRSQQVKMRPPRLQCR